MAVPPLDCIMRQIEVKNCLDMRNFPCCGAGLFRWLYHLLILALAIQNINQFLRVRMSQYLNDSSLGLTHKYLETLNFFWTVIKNVVSFISKLQIQNYQQLGLLILIFKLGILI